MKYLPFILLIICTSCKNNRINLEGSDIHCITFDAEKSTLEYIFDKEINDDFTIIPLESNNNCLLSSIDKIEIENDTIFILDKFSNSIFIFDINGKYISKICSLGAGPGEYNHIIDMTVHNSSIFVIDDTIQKDIEYDFNGNVRSENNFYKDIWGMNIFSMDNNLYLVNNWSISNTGNYRLFEVNPENYAIKKMLPFKKEPKGLGINNIQYSIYNNHSLIIYSACDTIFKLEESKIFPLYAINYKQPKLHLKDKDVRYLLEEKPKEIIGINSINESSQFIFFDIISMEKDFRCIYSKNDNNIIIYNNSIMLKKFDNESINIHEIINDQIIYIANPDFLLLRDKYHYQNHTFTNKAYEKRLKEVIKDTKEDDNPILFIFNLKTITNDEK